MLTVRPTSSLNLAASLDRLPVEILLDIIPYIPYSPDNFSGLCLTCTKIRDLVKCHEHSLVAEIKNCQFCSKTLSLFPGLKPQTFSDLSVLHHRLATLEELHGKWLRIVNHGVELQWLKGRWETIHKAGLLLLYRLVDAKSYITKIELMQSLPATSLVCLLFKLVSSTKILRIYGPEPINSSFCQNNAAMRTDIELALEELLLQHGPEFFIALLNENPSSSLTPKSSVSVAQSLCKTCGTGPSDKGMSTTWAVSTLQTEIASMEARQQPFPDGQPKPLTLIASLKRAIATRTHCDVGGAVGKMWELLSGTAFDHMDENILAKVVNGEAVVGGYKRMGF